LNRECGCPSGFEKRQTAFARFLPGSPVGEGVESGARKLDYIAKGEGINGSRQGNWPAILGDWFHNENCWLQTLP
jgi:hypothetical protein